MSGSMENLSSNLKLNSVCGISLTVHCWALCMPFAWLAFKIYWIKHGRSSENVCFEESICSACSDLELLQHNVIKILSSAMEWDSQTFTGSHNSCTQYKTPGAENLKIQAEQKHSGLQRGHASQGCWIGVMMQICMSDSTKVSLRAPYPFG